MSQNLERLKQLLAEMFQLDQADLDFGIYRIMNAKRDEITRFLERDLLPQVRDALGTYERESRAILEEQLQKAQEQARQLGFQDPMQAPRVRELQARYNAAFDLEAAEQEVYSHLYNFFRRYYQEGDFISLRRYKEGVYAIPYQGEEVKLYWANHDQYYIKTSEYLRNYTFKLPSGKRVHFKLVEADTEKDNNRALNGNERRFILSEEQPLAEENGELVVRFEYRPHPDKAKQADLDAAAVDRILNRTKGFDDWRRELAALTPTEKNPNRTLLEKHLTDYTARNTFDYFIHKDLGGFLRRELDFYIKNEVMHLDDIESETAPRVEQYLSKIKAIRRIAHKIIDFLAQIENFQKKLWLKKKFVVETRYCITLDRIFAIEDDETRDWLLDQIIRNAAQREEWVRLCAIDEIEGDLATPGYSKPLEVEFLKAYPTLVVDTRHFDEAFKLRLLAAIPDIDEETDGLLIHSENFQALSLLQARYRKCVKTVAIDPPYNRQGDGFPYKDNYKHSSWLSMMNDRLGLAWPLFTREGALFSNIDENERDSLQAVLDGIFGRDNRIAELIWAQNTTHSQSPLYSTNHEYIEVYVRDRVAAEQAPAMFREPKPGYRELMALIAELNPHYPPVAEVERAIQDLFDRHIEEYKAELREQGLEYDEETRKQDPWRGIYNYRHAEYRDAEGRLVPEAQARAKAARLVVWRESDPSAPAQKQSPSTRDPNDPNFRFYRPTHPKTGKPCPPPKTGWRWPYSWPDNSRDSFEALDRAGRIVWGEDETKIPQYKRFLHEVETNVAKSFFHDYTDGEKQIAALFGTAGLFPTPKPTTLPARFISQTCGSEGLILDHFAGSGTTGHAVINLNREDGGRRKFILMEMGEYFDSVLVPRLKKVIFTPEWKDGKPKRLPTPEEIERSPRIMKILRLESYEDTLNNLELKRTETQESLLEQHRDFREDYVLRYMLDVESRGSPSLLNIERFEDPFNYTLNIATGSVGEAKPTVVDLVETFNYLIGLRVRTMDHIGGVRVVTGLNPQGERVLILWRKTRELDNDALDAWFRKQGYNTRDQEYDVIYVNGDNNLENLRRADQTWKVRLIEEEFRRLMFDVQDV